MSGNFWLTGEEFRKIRPLLPNKPRGMPRVNHRRALSGIFFFLQRGYRWSDVPPAHGPAKMPHDRHKRWSKAGVFTRLFESLAQDGADRSVLMIDASHVRTHRIAANAVKRTPPKAVPSANPEAG